MPDDAATTLTALRDTDPDRYLATLYAPEDRRAALGALYLFNAEIAAIRDRVSEPLPGEMRIQWWRDMLAADGGGEAGGHPLAAALRRAIAEHKLPIDAFERYLDARIFDLYDDPMPATTDLEGYCGETASAIIQLAALILDPEAAPAFAAAAGHAGCAQAIAGLLLLVPRHRARGQCFVPADILAAAGTDRDRFVSEEDAQGAARAIEAMAALARGHMQAFEREAKGMPATLRPAFLPAALAPAHLDRIARRGFDAAVQIPPISPLRRHWIYLLRAARGWG